MKAGLLAQFVMPVKFRRIRGYLPSNTGLKMLDVGAGGDTCRMARRWFPDIEFHGIDRADSNYFATYGDDYTKMDRFYDLDLESNDLSEVPDDYFDAIVFTQCIEHLTTGRYIVRQLAGKLALGGVMYIEFPNPRSLHLPWGLHFSNDPTHIALYDFKDVAQFAIDAGLRVVRAGRRRGLPESIVVAPLAILNAAFSLVRGSDTHTIGRGLLDLVGFSDYVLCQKARVEVRNGCLYWTTDPEVEGSNSTLLD